MCGRKGRGTPEPRLSGAVADRAEDVEGDPAGRDSPPAGVEGPDPEGQVVEEQRALRRPGALAVGLEDNRREQLDPVADELAVAGLAQLAGFGVDPKAPGTIPGHAGGAHVGGAGAHRVKRLGDPASDELEVARRLRALPPFDRPLAVLAAVAPRLLPRQQLGEHVGPAAATRRALVALAPMAALAIAAIQLDPRSRVLKPGALHPRCGDPRHRPRLAAQPDRLAQRDAGGGTGLAKLLGSTVAGYGETVRAAPTRR
jgi:hypothetical protein